MELFLSFSFFFLFECGVGIVFLLSLLFFPFSLGGRKRKKSKKTDFASTAEEGFAISFFLVPRLPCKAAKKKIYKYRQSFGFYKGTPP